MDLKKLTDKELNDSISFSLAVINSDSAFAGDIIKAKSDLDDARAEQKRRERNARRRQNARERDAAMRSLGLTKVRGSVSGRIYWE